nr:MarR family transcriptional regulator [Planosporangium thailandense]
MVGILAAIACAGEGGGCHPKELAARCALDASTISRAVAALVERGLVRRSPDPADGRARLLTLTPDGRTALAKVEQLQSVHLAEALRDWTAEEVDAFAVALGRFVAGLTAHLDAAHPDGMYARAAPPAVTSPATGAPPDAAPESSDDRSQPETSKLEAAL